MKDSHLGKRISVMQDKHHSSWGYLLFLDNFLLAKWCWVLLIKHWQTRLSEATWYWNEVTSNIKVLSFIKTSSYQIQVNVIQLD